MHFPTNSLNCLILSYYYFRRGAQGYGKTKSKKKVTKIATQDLTLALWNFLLPYFYFCFSPTLRSSAEMSVKLFKKVVAVYF